MWQRVRSRLAGEGGAALILTSVAMVALVGVTALVIDLGALRSARSASRVVTDAAAAAGALDIQATGGDGQAACETALAYLELNLPGAKPTSGTDCSTFPTACDDSTPEATTTGTLGPWVATITYPVHDTNSLMNPAAIGAGSQPASPEDGKPCERIGVAVRYTRTATFAKILGVSQQNTGVHTVARGTTPTGFEHALNVLILERYDCDAFTASGSGGGTGGIIVDAVLHPDTGQLDPGFAAVDSDASGTCAGNGVIDVNGSTSVIRADGPQGCKQEAGTHIGAGGLTVGEGCGRIWSLAPGAPGCNYPACTSGGTVLPDPERRFRRVTRAQVDYLFNCKPSYPFPAAWDIDGCPDPPAPHIDNLIAAYKGGGAPAGFTRWTELGYSCSVDGPPGTLLIASGDIHVDCPNFSLKRTAVFTGGDVIFDGDVTVTASGVLAINANPAGAPPYAPGSSAAVAYFRGGTLSKSGAGQIIMHRTLVYFSKTSRIAMAGGSGALIWTAPTSGTFTNLALWSDSPLDHDLAGQANIQLEGLLFAPWAPISYQGNGSQQQVAAQFVSRTLSVAGNGLLVVRPVFNRSILFPEDPISQLIR